MAIVHILLPKITPGENMGDYKTLTACVEWLEKLGGGSTWENEMDAVQKDHCASIISSTTRLF